MIRWVLPNVLSIEDVQALDVQLLKVLSNVSTGVVLKYINDFIQKNLQSPDPDVQMAATKLNQAYEEVNQINEYLASDDAKNLADTLASLQYSDIRNEVEDAKLLAYRSLIIELLSEDPEFIESYKGEVDGSATRGYKSAYTAKLDKENMLEALKDIDELSQSIPGQMGPGMRLKAAISNNMNLFKNGSNKVNRPTVLRKAIYKKDKLKSLLKGIDYLLEKKQSGAAPRSWRRI